MSEPVNLDRALVRRVLAGDQRAFRSMFDQFFPRLYRFALVRLDGDQQTAKDVVQQTFCKAIERLDTYRGEAPLYAWFCRICRNTLIDHCRRRGRESRLVVPIEDNMEVRAVMEALSAAASDEPENRARQRDVRRLVQSTLDYLPAHYGNVLEWKYIEGLSVKEIAERMEMGPKAVESLLTRARNAFREAVGAVGGAAGFPAANMERR